MAGIEDMGDVNETLRSVAEQARDAWGRLSEEVELGRRMRENPMAVLGVAAAAGFVLGGGLAIGAAIGAMRAASSREDVPAGATDTEH